MIDRGLLGRCTGHGLGVGEELLVEETCDYVRLALPGLEPQPVRSRTCWVTRLPWGDDGLVVWRERNVHVVAGHNLFKLAPWIGTAVADAIADGERYDELHPDAELGGTPARAG